MLALVAACASRDAARVEAPVDLSIPPMSAPKTSAAKDDKTCTLAVAAAPLSKSDPACILDEQVSEVQGLITYPCHGDGPLQAVFGKHKYEGRISNGEAELELRTELEWEGDGCRWGTTAIIRGVIGNDLAWSYSDYVLRGDRCSGTCRATTTLVRAPDDGEPPPSEPLKKTLRRAPP